MFTVNWQKAFLLITAAHVQQSGVTLHVSPILTANALVCYVHWTGKNAWCFHQTFAISHLEVGCNGPAHVP